MLGFAMRAGRVVFGTDTVIASIKARGQGRARLVLVSSDASEGTRKKLGFKAEYFGVPLRVTEVSSSELGDALGKSYAPVTIAVCDDNFAKEILKSLETEKRDTTYNEKGSSPQGTGD